MRWVGRVLRTSRYNIHLCVGGANVNEEFFTQVVVIRNYPTQE